MKLGQLISPELDKILGRLMGMNTEQIKGATLIKVVRLAKRAAEEAKTFNDARIKICEGLAKKDEDGKPIMIDIPIPTDQVSNGAPGQKAFDFEDEALEKLNKEIQGMLDSEIKLQPSFNPDEFDTAGISGTSLLHLEPFIKA